MKNKWEKKKARASRIRSRIRKTSAGKFRISIFRSNKHLSVQLIDDVLGRTLVHVSTLSSDVKSVVLGKLNKAAGKIVGAAFAKKCAGYIDSEMVVDRGCYAYAGIVAEFIDTVRVSGIKI